MITRTRKLRAAVASLLALPLSALGMDLDKKVEFHIPAQDLSTALIEFSKQARLQVIVSADLTGQTTQGVSGQKAIRQALSQLLDPAGLRYRPAGETSITVGKSTAAEPQATAAGSGNAWIRLAQADRETARDAGEARPITEGKLADIGIPEILVKGSRSLNIDIARTRDDAQPYVIFNREKIEESAAVNLETFLRDRLSMNTVGMATSQRLTQSGSGSTFNLRGLGATQTLILIDGHRPAPGTSFGASPRQADLNSIPMSAVERIEVLPATASGIYGGGATGGVINIVLRHDYSGVEAKATYGNTFASDVAQRRFDLAAGFNPGENTNVMVIGSYSDQNELLLGERQELVDRYYDIARANAPARLLQPPLAYTPNIRSATGSNLVLDDGRPLNSPITHVPVGYAGGDGGTALLANAGRYNLDLAGTQQAPAGGGFQIAQAPRIESLRAEVRHEFSPRVRAFLDGTFSETYTSGRAPVSLGALVPYRVSASAPNNPFTTDILVTAPINFADYIETTQTQKSVLGGVIFSLPRNWQAEADYTWARTRLRQDGYLAIGGAENARVANGTINLVRDTNVFPVDLAPILSGTDIYALQNISYGAAAVRVAGPVYQLPAGPIALSTLLEYREEKYADTISRLPGSTLFYPARSSATSSAYVEARIPLVSAANAMPGVKELEVQLAARADEYRTTGRTGFVVVGSNTPIVTARNENRSVNPTLALRYQPIDDVAVRLSYGTGFVAPNVSQLAASPTFSTSTFVDPRRGNSSVTLPAGAVLSNGNANLEPEESESWSLGFVLTPRVVPGFRVSLDYTRIRKTDNIATYPTGLQGLVNDEALFSGRIQRGNNLPGDPAGWAGPITFVDNTLFNIASAEIEAFDMQLDYGWQTRFGAFAFSTVATRQTHYKTRTLAGQPELENIGLTYANPQGFTGSAELTWRLGAWTAGWLTRYYDDYLTANPALSTNAAVIALQGNGGRVPSQAYHDVFVGWKPQLSGEGFVARALADTEARLGVRNVFDKMPPFDANIYNLLQVLYHSPVNDSLGANYQLAITRRF